MSSLIPLFLNVSLLHSYIALIPCYFVPSHKNLSSSKVIDSVSNGKRLLLASQSAALGTKKEGKGLWYNEQ